jgi:hypothetical protein
MLNRLKRLLVKITQTILDYPVRAKRGTGGHPVRARPATPSPSLSPAMPSACALISHATHKYRTNALEYTYVPSIPLRCAALAGMMSSPTSSLVRSTRSAKYEARATPAARRRRTGR